jgi:hypothetical protein
MSARVLRDTHPRARKPNTCDSCYRPINRGETYRRVDAVGDDGLYSHRSCAHCEAVFAHIWTTDPDVRYYDEGIDLHEYLADRGSPLLGRFRKKWAGVDADQLTDELAHIHTGT